MVKLRLFKNLSPVGRSEGEFSQVGFECNSSLKGQHIHQKEELERTGSRDDI
jgi:hypothetical protein